VLLEGKRVIITGGLTGIGKATVIEMAKEGASVVSMSRKKADSPQALAVIDEAKKAGNGKVAHICCDVTNQAIVNAAVKEAVAFMGGLDAVVNSAGLETAKLAEDLVEEDLLTQCAVSLHGTAFMCAAAFPYLKENGGSLINYSSMAGLVGYSHFPAYSAGKAAVLGYSRTITRDWGPYKIRVNMVCPTVMTELVQDCINESPELEAAIRADWKNIHLGGELGDAIESAYLNCFLASDKSTYITGQTINVDGGWIMSR